MNKTKTFLWLIIFCCCCACCMAQESADTLDIALISDINDSYGSQTYSSQVFSAIDFIGKSRPDLVLCVGDMIAGQSLKLNEDSIRAMWSSFDASVRQPLCEKGIEVAFTYGNHDGTASPRFSHERNIAREYWLKERPKLDFVDYQLFPERYSFFCKGVFFAVIDASTAKVSDECKSWLGQQLELASVKAAKLRVVIGHLPLYAIAEGRNRSGDVLVEADKLATMFAQSGVDYYISGHHHAFYYSRKGPLKMIACGALGGGARKLIGSNQLPQKTFSMLRLVPGDKEFKLTTYRVDKKPEKIDISQLPARIVGFNGESVLALPKGKIDSVDNDS